MADVELIAWLEGWYESVCNGEREHTYGVKIDTLDNPGWHIRIDLRDSKFENMEEREVESDKSESDWFICKIKGRTFEGYGDPRKLSSILQTFRDWIENA